MDSHRFLETLRGEISHKLLLSRLARVEELLAGEPDQYGVIKALGNTVEVQNSVPTAVYCFLRSPQDYEEVVTFAVNLGGDADTLGAMAGAIAGALHGEEAVPSRWSELLEHRDRIVAAADRLWDRSG